MAFAISDKLLRDHGVKLGAPISSSSKILGKGAWSVVYEVRLDGSTCAAKKLYDSVREESARQIFLTECQLLSRLRHPNIVQFMGVTETSETKSHLNLALVMEKLCTDLERFISTHRRSNRSGIPLPIKLHILMNVSSGLMYLHSKSLVLGSLCGYSVLLTEGLQAKLTALGRTQNFQETNNLCHCPGINDYMPPEALKPNPRYDGKVDCFSLGHLALYLLNEDYPTPVGTGSQLTRRMKWVSMLGIGHPLYGLVLECLQDPASKRPDTMSINDKLTQIAALHPKTLLAVAQLQHGPSQVRDEEAIMSHSVRGMENSSKVKSDLICTIKQSSGASSSYWSSSEGETLVIKQKLAEAMNKIDKLENEKATLEKKVAAIRQSNKVLVERLEEANTTAKPSDNRGERPEWIVEKDEIQIISSIGSGAYADVSVAVFRGTKVAAKRIHSVIISDYNFAIFSREMRIASMIRHPNLVQFIGAIVDTGLVILMELMQTSLSNKLKQGTKFSNIQILSIAMDCACALNYLHLRKPHAIIHRDVSSPNILLEPVGTIWKAKISDLGTANMIDCIGNRTESYGNPNYIAPEGRFAHLQSARMDTYSLGVVLMEITVGEFPYPSRRQQQLERLSRWPPMQCLVCDCVSREPEMRPTMSAILHRLNIF